MEPLSVMASVAGILSVAAKVSLTLTNFIKKERDAPRSMSRILTEVSDLSTCLAQLTPFIRGTENLSTTRKAAVSVEQVVAINTSCVLTLSELEEILHPFQIDQPMNTGSKLRWAWNEQKIDSILTRVRASKSSLNLILTIFTSTTMYELQSSMGRLDIAVKGILEHSADVSRRLASMETKIADSIHYAGSTIKSLIDTSDDASTIRPIGHETSADLASTSGIGQSNSQLGVQTQQELEASRVYKRTSQRHSTSSLPSALHSATGWSMLSGLSLAQISSVSVVSLPVSYDELWNPQHYMISHGLNFPAYSLRETDTRGENADSHYMLGPDLNGMDNSTPLRVVDSSNFKPSMPLHVPITFDTQATYPESPPTIRKIENLVKRIFRSPRYFTKDYKSASDEEMEKHLRLARQQKPLTDKVLLLGIGDSGKSTVLKQLALRFTSGFSIGERKESRQVLFSNMLIAFRIIFEEMRALEIEYQHETSMAFEEIIVNAAEIGPEDTMTRACLIAMRKLWADEALRKVVSRGNEYALYDNINYNIRNIDRYFSEDYIPTDADILHLRLRTTGITETVFGRPDNLNLHVFDVGGARSERKKWVHSFEGVHCLIFTVPLSGYDQCLLEDVDANQIEESLLLFESILNLYWFKYVPIILLFTKVDMLKGKIRTKPIKDYFPNYTGGNDDIDAAKDFFADKFEACYGFVDRKVEIMFTNATDIDQFEVISWRIEACIREEN